MDYEISPEEDRGSFISHARVRSAARLERDPIVGDTVHFWDETACRAAIVTQDDLDTVWLAHLMPGETSWRPVRDVPHSEAKDGLSWHWPESE